MSKIVISSMHLSHFACMNKVTIVIAKILNISIIIFIIEW